MKILSDTGDCRVGKLTLLTGINGRGKSSFLQALLLLSQSLRKSGGDPTVLFPNGDWCSLGRFSDLLREGDIGDSLEIGFTTDAEIENDFMLKYVKSREKPTLGIAKSCVVDGHETLFKGEEFGENGSTMIAKKESKSLGIDRTTYSDLSELQRLRRMFFVSSDRIAAQDEERLDESLEPFYMGARGQYVLNVLAQCSKEQILELQSKMDYVLGGAGIEIEKDVDTNRVFLRLRTNNSEHFFRPSNVGFGYSYIISSLLSIVLSKQGDTIIVENPEAHLHPQAQSRLMQCFIETITQKKVQVFIETHSDHIVNATLLGIKRKQIDRNSVEILYFESNNVGAHIANLDITNNGRVKNPPKGFCDQYAMDLRDLMTVSYE